MIVAAAVRVGGAEGTVHAVPAPGRHGDVLQAMEGAQAPQGPMEQGFIDASEGFVSRARAFAIAVREGQVRSETPQGTLTSEDLWDAGGDAPQPARERGRTIEPWAVEDAGVRAALRAAAHILGPGLAPEAQIEGEVGLTLAWRHREAGDVTLALRPEAWRATEADPGAVRGIMRRAERAGASAVIADALGAAWTLGGRRCTVRARAPALARRWRPAWGALGAQWMRVQHPVEIMRATWRALEGQAGWPTLYDIAWARTAKAGAAPDGPTCHEAVWMTFDADQRAKREAALRRVIRSVQGRSPTPDVAGAARAWDAREIVERASGTCG